jgi:hypothetical protein
MTLEKLSGGVSFVQNTAPPASDAVDGDVFIDTSESPPQPKVFDASAGTFVQPQAGIDWARKTPQIDAISNGGSLTVSGSGYIFAVVTDVGFQDADFELSIDGAVLTTTVIASDASSQANAMPLHHRFNSSFTLNDTASGGVVVTYVLD